MKEYRQNSHAFPLMFWALLCTATAGVLFIHSRQIVSRMLRLEEILAGVALLVLGPALLASYLVRARRIWVSVDAVQGIRVSGRYTIPWTEILVIQRRRPRFRRTTGPTQVSAFNPDLPDLGGIGDLGCGTSLGEFGLLLLVLIAAFLAYWLIFFVMLPLLIIPLLEVLAPFGDRITISTRGGRLVLRDLRESDDFVRAVSHRVRVVER
jgi:hypothetical protein